MALPQLPYIPSMMSSIFTGLAQSFRQSRARAVLTRIGVRDITDQDLSELNPIESDIVMIAVQWLMRAAPESVLKLDQRMERGSKRVWDHPLLTLLEHPNDIHTMSTILQATVLSWAVSGNAYWHLIRNAAGKVVGLEYVPDWAIWPYTNSSGVWARDFITGYYFYGRAVGGDYAEYLIPPKDIVHFRFGLDPYDTRLGLSPLKTVMREVFTDKEAARWTATLLYNNAVPGMIMSPKYMEQYSTEEEMKRARDYVERTYGQGGRGRPWLLAQPLDVSQFGFSPEQLNLRALRRIPEERIAAALGVSPTTLGLGAGQESNTYNNSREMRAAAYESTILPLQGAMADALNHRLLPEFMVYRRGFVIGWDTSRVKALAEDANLKSKRVLDEWMRGGIMRSELREELGRPTTENDDVYLVPKGMALMTKDGEIVKTEPDPPMPPPNDQGDQQQRREGQRQNTRDSGGTPS